MNEPGPPPSARPRGKQNRLAGPPEPPSGAARARQRRPTTTGRGPGSRPPTAQKRSSRRWTYLTVVAVPLVALLVYGLVGANSGGGAAKIGETFTSESGLSLTVAAPQPYVTDDTALVGPDEQAFQTIVVLNNGSDEAVGASGLTISAAVNGTATEMLPLDGVLSQDVEPGVQLNVPFRFKVSNGTSGALQISVKAPSEKTVYFTGTI